jgi:hypothetical protein
MSGVHQRGKTASDVCKWWCQRRDRQQQEALGVVMMLGSTFGIRLPRNNRPRNNQ